MLDFVVEKTRYKPHCLLVVPIYYITVNNGDAQFNNDSWQETCKKLKINLLTRNIRGSENQK